MNKYNFGYSLIELLITLSILSILITIAYPIYTQHITYTHRKQVQIILFDLASRMERYYLENNHSYAEATVEKLGIETSTTRKFYEIFLTSNSVTFRVQAKPINNQATHDTTCGLLALNEVGEKSIDGKGTVAECW